jgi:hypothetical protein
MDCYRTESARQIPVIAQQSLHVLTIGGDDGV